MKRNIFCGFAAILGVFLMLFTTGIASAESKYKYKKTREIVALVRDAAALIEKEGVSVFPEFRKKGGRWFYADTYIFIWEMNGLRVVYPPNPKGEGKNMSNLKDINGKPIGRMFITMVSGGKGEAWCHYQWPKPNDTVPSWKSTYLKRVKGPSGKEYVIGCGMYDAKMEKKFVVALVEDAVALIRSKGRDAFDKLRDKSSEFIFKDVYVFVTCEDGTELVNPMFPKLEGRNILDLKDAEGKYATRDMFKLLKNKDAIWKEGAWPKPGEEKPSKKLAYIRKIILDGKVLAVGAGFCPD